MAHRVWKDGMRRGIVYVEKRDLAQKVMEMTGRARVAAPVSTRRTRTADEPLDSAMAVYTDRRGRAFAWQIPFAIDHWENVTALVDGE